MKKVLLFLIFIVFTGFVFSQKHQTCETRFPLTNASCDNVISKKTVTSARAYIIENEFEIDEVSEDSSTSDNIIIQRPLQKISNNTVSNSDRFQGKGNITLSGKKGDFAYQVLYIEAIYRRDITLDIIGTETEIILHAKDASDTYCDLSINPATIKIEKNTIFITEDFGATYSIVCDENEFFVSFIRELTQFIKIKNELSKY